MVRRISSKSWHCQKLAAWPWASYNSRLLLRVMRGPTVTMKCPSARRAGTAVPLSSLAPPGSPLTLSGPPWLWKFPSLPLPFRIKFTPTWLHRTSHPSFGIHPILHTSPEVSWSSPPPCPSPLPFTWRNPAYPFRTAPGHRLGEGSQSCLASPSDLPAGCARTRPCHSEGLRLFSHLFLLLPAGLLEAGDNSHSTFYSQQPGFHQDTRPRSFWTRKPLEAQSGDKS